MIDPTALKNIAATSGIGEIASPKPATDAKGSDFGQMLVNALEEVNGAQTDAKSMQDDFLTGKDVDIHDVMIAQERASTAFQLTLAVRNKTLEAFQEINRLQV